MLQVLQDRQRLQPGLAGAPGVGGRVVRVAQVSGWPQARIQGRAEGPLPGSPGRWMTLLRSRAGATVTVQY